MRFDGDRGEATLDQVGPGGAGRREGQLEARVLGQPRVGRSHLVRIIVVNTGWIAVASTTLDGMLWSEPIGAANGARLIGLT